MADFQALYKEKLKTAEGVVGMLHDGESIMSDIACSQPISVIKTLGESMAAGKLKNMTVNVILDLVPMPWYKNEEVLKNNRVVTWFSGGSMRKLVNAGFADVMPGTYWDFPAVIREEREFDYAIITVSPMDKFGYFSAGLCGSVTPAILEKSKNIILEVNENMPHVVAGPQVHISEVLAVCENNSPIVELPSGAIDAKSKIIGDLIAERIPDGATLQLGIGAIPNAVGMALVDKKHLGIHTEMFTDSMVDLLLCGAADNSAKPIHKGKTVATFALGSKKMYDYINDNPMFEMLEVDYVNNPYVIAQHPNFISVNSAVEVDFYGQVCAESIGMKHHSGSGGQLDYVRGAVMSKGGQSFIAFASTAANDTVSKINPILKPGSMVTTGKNEVDMIVTEYGIAKLRGRTLSERTKALISIAHPNFREELTFEAKKMNILI